MVRADGMPSADELLAVLEHVSLGGLSREGARATCAAVIDPPPVEGALDALRPLRRALRVEVLARLAEVAQADGVLQAAEKTVLGVARERLGLEDADVRAATRAAERERWRRAHALARARRADHLRTVVVVAAGLLAPVVVILRAGLAHARAPGAAFLAGIDALGGGYGLPGAVVFAMGIAIVAAVGTSALTLRGWRVAWLERQQARRVARLRENLTALLAHLEERLAEIRHDSGARLVYKVLDGHRHTFRAALDRLASAP